MSRTAIIIGGGPAGLTAAYELLARTDVRPVVLEQGALLGGLSRTECYKGNRIDIGGHRFFSKSDRVMRWWLEQLPLAPEAAGQGTLPPWARISAQPAPAATETPARVEAGASSATAAESAAHVDPLVHAPADGARTPGRVMLVRRRLSRIYFLRRFFDYPLSLSPRTLRNLGPWRVARIAVSYFAARVRPIRPEQNLEQFFINRFGRELYRTFFEAYTEKVWGAPCRAISAAWGAQRVKGLSISGAIMHAARSAFRRLARATSGDLAQKGTETSLIEQFLYPALGPGQMWEVVGERVAQMGGEVRRNMKVVRVLTERGGDCAAGAARSAGESGGAATAAPPRVIGVEAVDGDTGARLTFRGDYVFSTMPIRELVQSMDAEVPPAVRSISDGLVYRDFITVGLLLKKLPPRGGGAARNASSDAAGGEACGTAGGRNGAVAEDPHAAGRMPDNWIYIQEPDVRVGRLQIFNNWSPYLVANPRHVWIGLEYFCDEGDDLWTRSDRDMLDLARDELVRIGLIEAGDVLDGTVVRVPKAYPAYFGTYERFDELRDWLDRCENLVLIGRNGMHRYNNQDHSMLAAMCAVDNLVAGRTDRANIWAVNTEQEYHEEGDRGRSGG